MSFETGLRAKLLADTAVAALVSSRVHWQNPPEDNACPSVTLVRVSNPCFEILDGPAGLQTPRIQVECRAATFLGARALRDAVVAAIDGYRGPLDGGPEIQGTIKEDDRDIFEEIPRIFRTDIDFTFWIEE